ncbi:hypothetical protein B0A49_08782 [Cryomyces minteri]|uniref:Uncharacterized protein n=1 Tax=Cryomyces minteri TaxID=331657 RepID=A0A4U0WJU2_9PEZI|nr:hypothetical protein B0A49_08782 [Cryomyces minteri]
MTAKTTKEAENAGDEEESSGEEGENKSKTNSTARLGVAGSVDMAKLQGLLEAQFVLTFRMAKAMSLSLEEILATLSAVLDELYAACEYRVHSRVNSIIYLQRDCFKNLKPPHIFTRTARRPPSDTMAYPDPDDLELPDYPYYTSEAGVSETLYDLDDAPGETTMGPRHPILEYDPAFDPGETMMGPRCSVPAYDPRLQEGETVVSPRYSTDLKGDPAVDPDASYSAAEPIEEDSTATQPDGGYITVNNKELRCIRCPESKAPFTRVCTLRRHLKETHNMKVLNPTGNKHPKTAAEFDALEEAQLAACAQLLDQRRWDR